MAIVVKEERLLGGKRVPNTRVYKSDQLLVTKKMREEADKFDEYLAAKMQGIRDELKKKGLLEKGKKKNILKMRYELGKRLKFVNDCSIVHPDDKKFVWRALFDHASDLAPGLADERANNRPETSFFAYCYKLSIFPWDMIESGRDWSSWQRVFDLAVKNDERILSWLSENKQRLQSVFKVNWLKKTTKALTQQFANRDTTVLSSEELMQELEEMLSKLA